MKKYVVSVLLLRYPPLYEDVELKQEACVIVNQAGPLGINWEAGGSVASPSPSI